MGRVMGFVADVFSSGKKDIPLPAIGPAADISAEAKKAKKARPALLATEGGATGVELLSGQVGRRETLFGN